MGSPIAAEVFSSPQGPPAGLSPEHRCCHDDYVGNGATIRNLQIALEDAEALIISLRGRTDSREAEAEFSKLKDLNSALEARLLTEQNNLASREKECAVLKSKLSQSESSLLRICERVRTMIKEDAWMLPNGLEGRTPIPPRRSDDQVAPEDLFQLLDILEEVRKDALAYKKKEIEQKSQSDISVQQRDMLKLQRELTALEVSLSLTTYAFLWQDRHNESLQQLRKSQKQYAEAESHNIELTLQIDELKATTKELRARTEKLNQVNDLSKANAELSTEVQQLRRQIVQKEDTMQSERTRVEQFTETDAAPLNVAATQTTPPEIPTDVSMSEVPRTPPESVGRSLGVEVVGTALSGSRVTHRTSLKRALSPTFGSQEANMSTNEGELEIGPNASPTPQIDKLYTGPVVPTLTATSPRAAAIHHPSSITLSQTPIGRCFGEVAQRMANALRTMPMPINETFPAGIEDLGPINLTCEPRLPGLSQEIIYVEETSSNEFSSHDRATTALEGTQDDAPQDVP
ncbi:putative myosin-9 [Gregarina niphandrodes]|uniref:Myosin-9 n=1 Tax=Gregarina niphandrodes TaxID=110365 RepID=A0A023AXT5_GRENI|nr:putative myosin-9 [Gregarina niphandrodes]EZG43461.1 putative myosin-9 [Gregarina niphandrodes]|eukprot:XP_011133312.1 putative myosin-9 [Gregarina niphandrodes]